MHDEYPDHELDADIEIAKLEVEVAINHLKDLQDERFHRWYMRNVIVEE